MLKRIYREEGEKAKKQGHCHDGGHAGSSMEGRDERA